VKIRQLREMRDHLCEVSRNLKEAEIHLDAVSPDGWTENEGRWMADIAANLVRATGSARTLLCALVAREKQWVEETKNLEV